MYDRNLTQSVLQRLRALRNAISNLIVSLWGCSGCVTGLLVSLLLAAVLSQMGSGSEIPAVLLIFIGGGVGLVAGVIFGSMLAEQIVVWIDWAHQMLAASDLLRSGAGQTVTASGAGPMHEQTAVAAVSSTNPADGAEMIWVPAGQFMMGSAGDKEDASPVHSVQITQGFWLYRTAVTNEQYSRYLDANPDVDKPRHWDGSRFNAAQQPVVGVSWDDAVAYSAWAGVRLPTEAEWEYAARGRDGRIYPWGDEEPDPSRAVFGPGPTGPASVGGRPLGASWCGALDMAGNVSEWCADWYDAAYYRRRPEQDPAGPTEGNHRVLRGGSWFSPAIKLRASNRFGGKPDLRLNRIGFRPARTGP